MPRPLTSPYVARRDCRYCGRSFYIQHVGRHEQGHRTFWAHVDKSGECWIFTGPVSGAGYGLANRTPEKYAHRLAWAWLRGPIPDGYEVDHLCRVKLCVNPAHLEPVTKAENIRRQNALTGGSYQRSLTHCPKGHPYSGDNLIVRPEGWRACRECRRTRLRECRAAQKAAAA